MFKKNNDKEVIYVAKGVTEDDPKASEKGSEGACK